jgi:amino acid transporter
MSNSLEQKIENTAWQSDKKLKKVLTLQDLFFLSLGGIIGSGWLLGGVAAASTAGPASIISWIIGGIIVLFIALTFAEISAALPKSGGLVRYPHYAYGGYLGYIMGWAYLLYTLTVPIVEAEAVLTYASAYIGGIVHNVAGVVMLTPLGIVYGIILMFAFFLINWFGMKFFAKFNTAMTWLKFIIPVLTFVALLFVLNKANFTSYGGFAPLGFEKILYAVPTCGIVFSYLGFRQALNFGGEAKHPQRDIPIVTIFSIIVGIILYTMLEVAFVGAIKWPSGVTWATLTHTALGSAPYFIELKSTGIALFVAIAYFVLISSFLAPAGTGWIFVGSSARTMYGVAADGYYSPAFLRIHEKTKIPYVALITTTLMSLVFFLPFPSWYLLVGFISSAAILTYILGPLMLISFRKHAPDLYRPFRLPAAYIIAPIAFIAGALIMYWSGTETITLVIYIVLLGVPLFYLLYAPRTLGLSKIFSYTVGIVEFIITALILIIDYLFVFSPIFKEPLGTKTIIYIVSLFIMAIVWIFFTALTGSKVSDDHKKLFTSSYWFFGLIFITAFVSYFGAFGIDTVIPFPLDTIVMIVIYFIIYLFAIKAVYKTQALDEAVSEIENERKKIGV